jgi:hypothetical protein
LTFSHSDRTPRYGCPHDGVVGLTVPAKFTLLALAGAFTVGACSGLAGDGFAVVPGTPRADQDRRDTARATPTPRATPNPRATPTPRQTARPRATPMVLPSPSAETARDPATRRDRPKVTTIRLSPRPRPGPFQMDLFRKGDFMHQADKNSCVAGSTQTMMNIIDRGRPNRSTAFQQRLYQRGRELSPNKAKLGPIGIDLTGWAELLNTNGYGPYVVDGAATRRGAIRKAAKALRLTDRPVGLVTWRGAHSWVMSGFTATADPAYSDDFQVNKVYIQDVWYPYVSTIWGASRPPGSLVPVAALAEDYLPYARPRARWPKRDGKFMLILPQLPARTVVR